MQGATIKIESLYFCILVSL